MTISSSTLNARKVKNSLAKWLISLGGISVLFTLVLIFLYLLYVIQPIFESASVEKYAQHSIVNTQNVKHVGSDELKEVLFTVDDQGLLQFYRIGNKTEESVAAISPLSSEQLPINAPIADITDLGYGRFLIIDNVGQVNLVQVKFTASYTDDSREINPSIFYPLGEDPLPVDEMEQAITKLAFAMDDERATFIAVTEDSRLIKTTLVAEDDFSYDSEFEAEYQEIPYQKGEIDDLAIVPDMSIAFVRSGHEITVYETNDEYDVPERSHFILTADAQTNVTSMALLSGGSSLLVGDNTGKVSQWFEISTERGREFTLVRHFDASNQPITKIVTEPYRKSFYTFNQSGDMGVFYTTSEATLWQGKLFEQQPVAAVVTPRADGVITAEVNNGNTTITITSVHNEHPGSNMERFVATSVV